MIAIIFILLFSGEALAEVASGNPRTKTEDVLKATKTFARNLESNLRKELAQISNNVRTKTEDVVKSAKALTRSLAPRTVQRRRRDRLPCSRSEFKCDNGQCIAKQKWCDDVYDCSDGTDEYYCDGASKCMETYFACDIGLCIPLSGRCDGVADCPDGSDEGNCIAPSTAIRQAKTDYTTATMRTVSEAVAFLLNQRHQDYGWGTSVSTSRANVALMFSQKVHRFHEDEMKLMKKQLNIQLSLDLILKTPSLSHLALYINAMYATCQDPRNFQGMDLVRLLRSQTNKAMGSNFSLPLVLMTLCLANENTQHDERQLTQVYRITNNRIGSRALVVLAMECMRRKSRNAGYQTYFEDFFVGLAKLEDGNLDVYTKALVAQASNAVGYGMKSLGLASHQLEDGSFGDLLATYYAIPALLNSSLLDLKCDHQSEDEGMLGVSVTRLGLKDKEKQITYSLWIESGNDVNTHSMVLTYNGNKTFYDIMKMAKLRDHMYKFICDKTEKGKEVFSLAGIPNDAERGTSWTLYQATAERVAPTNSKLGLQELTQGVDKIFPRANSHFIFWLTRS